MMNRNFETINHEDAVRLICTAIDRVTDPSSSAPGEALAALSEILEKISERTLDYEKHLADVDGRAAGDRVMAHLAIAQMTIEVAAQAPLE